MMIFRFLTYLFRKVVDFRKFLIAFLLGVGVFAFVFGHYLPMQKAKSNQTLLSMCIDENQVLEKLCENKKFEEKWANIALELKKKESVKNETNKTTIFDDFNFSSTIKF